MKKNIKRASLIIMAVVIICAVFTACNSKAADTSDKSTTPASTIDVTTENASFTEKPIHVDMDEYVNEKAGGKPIVEIMGDEGEKLLSFDFSENVTSKIEVTIDQEIKDDSLYVTMSGDVTKHNLVSDGSLFDGLAIIKDHRSQFSVTYNNERTIDFIINLPNA